MELTNRIRDIAGIAEIERRGDGVSPKSLLEVLVEADKRVSAGILGSYQPVPTGFDQIDRVIGGGLKKGELVLLGGAQGLGKTICALQWARNIALSNRSAALYISFEHDEEYLLNRLICMESIDPVNNDYQMGMRAKDLKEEIITKRKDRAVGLYEILQSNTRGTRSLDLIQRYCNKLYLMKGSPTHTRLDTIEEYARQIAAANGGTLVVFIDYLQKVPVSSQFKSDTHKITTIVEGLKNLALSLDMAVVAVVAADREGLKAKRLRLHHLRGSSALDYECDIAIIMNKKWNILSKQHIEFNMFKAEVFKSWVIFSIEKNRAGQAGVDLEFQLRSEFFCFNPVGAVVEQKLIDDKVIAE